MQLSGLKVHRERAIPSLCRQVTLGMGNPVASHNSSLGRWKFVIVMSFGTVSHSGGAATFKAELYELDPSWFLAVHV